MPEHRATVSIILDGRVVEAHHGELLIEAAERAGTFVPRFCYHPRMEPVGVCRMCLVEVEGPRGATLQPACYLKVAEGMTVTTDSEKVKKAQDGVIEFLLANHPLDCPVCDKGGECPLQDQTLAHGSGETRFVEEKRHFVKPIELGPLVLLDRERCIQCSRCTRFAAEVAGDAQIAFAGRGDLIEVAASPTEPFDSVFSGNTVQICPVGALTATPYRFTARPWDLEQVESTCTTCSVGCRVAVQSSGDRLTRVLGVDSDPVNHGWLCDKGRFTLDAVHGREGASDLTNAATRVTTPFVRRDGELVATTWGEALARAAQILRDASAVPNGMGAIGGAALTNEGAFAWERLLRGTLGTENLDAQYGDGLDPALLQALPGATIDEAAHARVVLTLTGDLREELPVLFLRLREGIARGSTLLVELATGPSALRSLAAVSLPTRPGEAHLVAQALATGTASPDLALGASLATARDLLGESGEGVVVVAGRPNLAEDASIVEAALRTLADALPSARFLTTLRRANVRGALDMGLAPGLVAGRGFRAGVTGRGARAQLAALAAGEQRAVVLLGGCLIGNVLDSEAARAALAASDVVAVTGHGGATLAYADVILPATVAHERTGTVTNLEGRVTAVTPKVSPAGSAWSDVAIAAELAEALGASLGLASDLDAARVLEETTGYPAASVLADATTDGVVVGRAEGPEPRRPLDPVAAPGIASTDQVGLGPRAGATALASPVAATAPRPATLGDLGSASAVATPPVDAYAWRLFVARRLYDRGVAVQGSPELVGLVAPTTLRLHHLDLDRLGVAEGDRLVARGARGEVELPVERDDALARGVVAVDFGSLSESGADALPALVDGEHAVAQVRLETR